MGQYKRSNVNTVAKNYVDTNPFNRANSALMMLLVAAPMQTLLARTTNFISNTMH